MNIQNEGMNNEYRCTWIICLVKKFFLWKKSFFLSQKISFLVLGKLKRKKKF